MIVAEGNDILIDFVTSQEIAHNLWRDIAEQEATVEPVRGRQRCYEPVRYVPIAL
jgi:hypothetical protein